MSAANNGGPAFPQVELDRISGQIVDQHFGVTLHAYFAAKAMQAAITGHITHFGHDNYWAPKDIASYANEVADAMLERAK